MNESASALVSRIYEAHFANHGALKALGTLGVKWQTLPSGIQRRLCIRHMSKPVQPALLPHIRKMLEASDFDPRLTAMCVKLHAEHQRYFDAYQTIEHCLLKRTGEILSRPRGLIVKTELYQYISDIKVLTCLWRYLDIQTHKDTAEKHRIGDEVSRLFAVIRQDCAPLMGDLPVPEQMQFVHALLDLAEIADTPQHVGQVYELFTRSSAKNDLTAYAAFISHLKFKIVHTRNVPEWERYLSEFTRWLEEQVPDENACWVTVVRKPKRPPAPDKPLISSRPPKPKKPDFRVYGALLSGLELAGRTELARRLAQQMLERAEPIDLVSVCSRLMRCNDDAIQLLGAKKLQSLFCEAPVTDRNFREFVMAFLLLNDREGMIALHRKGALDRLGAVSQVVQVYSLIGDFAKLIAELSRIRAESLQTFAENSDSSALINVLNVGHKVDEFHFLQASSAILNEVAQPPSPKGIAIVVAKDASEFNTFPILALRELKQRGFAVVPLVAGVLDYHPIGIAEIDEIACQLRPAMNFARWQIDAAADWRREWVFDHGAHRILYDGVDIFWGIREFLSCYDRRYSIDFDDPSSRSALANLRRGIEVAGLCLRRIAEVGKRLNMPVRIVISYVHLGTNYFIRRYVQKLAASQNISLIHVSNAYENYFTNFAAESSTTIAAQDMTEHAQLSVAYFAPPAGFDAHYQTLPNKEELHDQVMQWIRVHRIRREGGAESSGRLAFLREERARGQKIVGLFGKVLFDLGMPRGDGPAHRDMRAWFDHTVAIARANEHVHLVVKPHPHEVRDEIALYPTEFLKDWLPANLPPNIHFLGHDELNLFELAEVLDLALMWNSTSAVELGVLGVPTVVGAYQAVIDYPVGHILPESRAHYEAVILSGEKLTPAPDVRLRSAALINYLRHPDVSIPYRYTRRGLTNKAVRNLSWISEDLEAFYAHGDPHVARIADRIAAIKQG